MVNTSQVLLATLEGQWVETMARIDDALDRRDRRAFRMWTMKQRSLSSRLSGLLLQLATTEA